MKRLLAVFFSLLFLCGCHFSEEKYSPESSESEEKKIEYHAPVNVTPEFAAVHDLSSAVAGGEVKFDESGVKESLILQDNKLGEYVFSPYQLHITAEMELNYSCVWEQSGVPLFFGLLNSDNEVFVVSADGGSLVGTLSMESVPEDDYQLILYSSNNPEVKAELQYQFR